MSIGEYLYVRNCTFCHPQLTFTKLVIQSTYIARNIKAVLLQIPYVNLEISPIILVKHIVNTDNYNMCFPDPGPRPIFQDFLLLYTSEVWCKLICEVK